MHAHAACKPDRANRVQLVACVPTETKVPTTMVMANVTVMVVVGAIDVRSENPPTSSSDWETTQHARAMINGVEVTETQHMPRYPQYAVMHIRMHASVAAVRRLIQRQETDYNGDFVFLGSNIDAVEVGADLGFQRGKSTTYISTSVGVTAALRFGSELPASEANGRCRCVFGIGLHPGRSQTSARGLGGISAFPSTPWAVVISVPRVSPGHRSGVVEEPAPRAVVGQGGELPRGRSRSFRVITPWPRKTN